MKSLLWTSRLPRSPAAQHRRIVARFSPRRRPMTVAPDFFDTEPRNWRARLALSAEVTRELSRLTDPQEMYTVFARRMSQLFPVSRHLTISRRGLRQPN